MIKNLNIFQLNILYQDLFNKLELYEELDEEYDLSTELDLIKEHITDKLGNLGYYIKYLQNRLEGVEEEKKRLSELEKKLKNNIEKKKDFIISQLDKLNMKKLDFGSITMFTRENESVILNDIEKVPEEFIRTIVKKEVDKNKVKDNLKKSGEIPDGVSISISKSLTIK